ncbi:MAG: anthranilate phosphoribosyltransferase [Candidatus Altiarchaeota archaeon]|nr:anthranilate phosphoribosyltransferase [Candidatus Altiarchaeota archaeon]
MKQFIQKLVEEKDLTEKESERAMETIMSGKATDAQIGSFLTALRMKGETATEIAAFARVMRKFSRKITPGVDETLVDVCGTGGDEIKTFNISTTSMFIVAATGIPVAKHGNRAITSGCGSADVLEELGVNLNLEFEKIGEGIEEVGIGFMFAPAHHSAMKYVMPARRELGVRTVFNILGPLTNPANASAQLMGVFDPNLSEKLAEVFRLLGLKHAMVVHGEPGLDEISTLGETKITELKDNRIKTYVVKPEDFGLVRVKAEDLSGGDKIRNARILTNILKGEDRGPKRDIVLLNAAAGIVVGDKAGSLGEGLEMVRDVLDSGKAYEKLNEFIGFTKQENFP